VAEHLGHLHQGGRPGPDLRGRDPLPGGVAVLMKDDVFDVVLQRVPQELTFIGLVDDHALLPPTKHIVAVDGGGQECGLQPCTSGSYPLIIYLIGGQELIIKHADDKSKRHDLLWELWGWSARDRI